MSSARIRAGLIAPLLGGIGLLVIVVGTFLPWLRSGHSGRNSYQAGGAVRRLLGTSGLIDDLLSLWPLVGLACAGAIALFLLGLRATATVFAGVSALSAGSASVAALATTATSYAQAAVLGPTMTIIGATLVALAVLLRALSTDALPRSKS